MLYFCHRVCMMLVWNICFVKTFVLPQYIIEMSVMKQLFLWNICFVNSLFQKIHIIHTMRNNENKCFIKSFVFQYLEPNISLHIICFIQTNVFSSFHIHNMRRHYIVWIWNHKFLQNICFPKYFFLSIFWILRFTARHQQSNLKLQN